MKIKFLPIFVAATITFSCGNSNATDDNSEVDSNENSKSINMSQETATVDLGAISFVHGVSFASQLKQQNLSFINVEELVKTFATYRTDGIGEFDVEASINVLREIAQKTENFKTVEGEDVKTASLIFSKLFYSDIEKSPLGDDLVVAKFEEGLVDFSKNETMPSQDSIEAYSTYMGSIQAKPGETFLAENAKRPEVKVTESGLQYEILTDAEGPKPTDTSTVVAHYEGALIDGTIFDSSYKRGEPTEFPLNQVIPGWTEGLQLMSVGAKYKFYLPYQLGYGERGAGQNIPPFSALVFIVELVEVK